MTENRQIDNPDVSPGQGTAGNKTFLVLTGVFVGGLALVAGAISFSHMRELASQHDQLGWKSYAFPVSVDGLEIVASLYLVAQHRAGRRPGWIPWVALIVGTAASLTANVAVGGADIIGKALAGWPALSMLVSVKLLFSMFEHNDLDGRPDVRDEARTPAAPPDVPDLAANDGRNAQPPSPNQRDDGTDTVPAVPKPLLQPAPHQNLADSFEDRLEEAKDHEAIGAGLHPLLPAARTARDRLLREGHSVSRDNLAEAMRSDGHGASNARISLLLKTIKAESRSSDSPTPRSLDVDSK